MFKEIQMRKPFIAGNWKMHKTIGEAVELVKALRAELDSVDGCDVAVCPPFPALAAVREALAGSSIGLGLIELPEAAGPMAAWSVVWFLLGFALYAVINAAAGSLVSRQEDAQGAVMIPTMLVLPGFFIAMISLSDPESTIAVVGSLADNPALVQRLQELGNYRNKALLGLPLAQRLSPRMRKAEDQLAAVVQAMMRRGSQRQQDRVFIQAGIHREQLAFRHDET